MHKQLSRLLIHKHRGYYLKYIALIYQIEVRSIVEIGVFQGKHAEVLRKEFPEAHLYLIDPWAPSPCYIESRTAISKTEAVYTHAFNRVKDLFEQDPQVSILRKTALEGAADISTPLDLVFIDANHDYDHVKETILAWKDKVRPGGILAGHNYGRKRLPGVKQAVDELFKDTFILGQDEVWLHIKKRRTEEDSNL